MKPSASPFERRPFPTTFSAGITLVELMVSGAILSVATVLIAQTTNLATASSRRGDALTQVQTLINRDLNWLRGYAHTWNCRSGCGANPSAPLRYGNLDATPIACSTLVTTFLSAAAADTGTPTRPFPIPTTLNTSQVLQVANGGNLSRSISLPSGTTGSLPQSLVVSYSYGGSPAFERRGSLLIQAGSWCTP